MSQFDVQAMGMVFHWTLNQELLFSAALTGKPVRKEDYAEYRWERCLVGSREDYAEANKFPEWEAALQTVNPWELKNRHDDVQLLAPLNNTD